MPSSRLVTGLAVAALVVVARAALAADPIVGTWEHQGANGVKLVVSFDADGSGKMNDVAIKWSASGDKLTLSAAGDETRYTFKVDGDKLVVSGGDLDAPTTFTRKGGAAKKAGLGGQIKEGQKSDAPAPEKKKGSIQGTWKDSVGTVFEIGEDCVKIGDNRLAATIGATEITITAATGQKVTWPYKVDGDTLELTINGQKQACKRVAEAKGVAPAPLEKIARAKTLVGKWEAADGTQVEFKADGTFVYNGNPFAYKATDGVIAINGNEWKYKLDGDTLTLQLPGEEPSVLKRVGGGEEPRPEPADDKNNKTDDGQVIEGGKGGNAVGAWDSKDGTLIIRADGTGTGGQGDFKWTSEEINGKKHLKFVQGAQWLAFPYTVAGDKLVFGADGKTVTLTRAGIAGVWVAEESSLDPQFYMSFTQYLILYKDGSVGYAKAEGSATRTQVSEHLERFTSGFEKGAEKKSVGTWKKESASTITLKLNWKDQAITAQYDLGKMILRVPGMGKLSEGATLDFKRK